MIASQKTDMSIPVSEITAQQTHVNIYSELLEIKEKLQQLQKMHNTFEYDDKAEGEMQIVVGAPVDYKQPQSSKRDHHAILQDTPSSVNIEEDITQSGLNLN